MTALSQVSGLPVLGPFFTRRVVPAIYSSGSTARAWQTAAPLLVGAHAVMLHDAPLAQEFAKRLLDEGIYAVGFFFPVVPQGQARIRTQMNAALTRADAEGGERG